MCFGMQSHQGSHSHGSAAPTGVWALAIAAIGVVYGDIGTSPLYAFREALAHVGGDGVDRGEVLGVLSLILWTLMLIVTVKYVIILLRLDNNGEGGTLALMALARSVIYKNTIGFLFLGILGAGLFFGDSMITPAISVLSAVEGLKIVTPAFEPYVLPITCAIIIGLFAVQHRGTGSVAVLFGPLTVIWFAAMGILGLNQIIKDPSVLAAFNPYYAAAFLATHGYQSFLTLGAVFLAVTGAEALYADLGHFGRRPVQLAWNWFVFPALALNYLGQGALVLNSPAAIENPFYLLVPKEILFPFVILATCATIIASQAVITGAFSMMRQAVNLGLLPRLTVKHTSAEHSGQIYMPQINYILMIGVLFLVLSFKTSSNLAHAYGISVTGAMVVDAIMALFVLWQIKHWRLPAVIAVIGPFLVLEVIFFSSNLTKVLHGGWVPMLIALTVIVVMATWIKGTFIINSRTRKRDLKIDRFIKEYQTRFGELRRVPGSAFFLSSDPNVTPAALMQNIKHNKVLHERNIILTVKVEPIPYVAREDRAIVSHLCSDFSTVVLRFGFKDDIDVQEELIALNRMRNSGIDFDWHETSLFLSRRNVRSHSRYGLPLWQDFIYVFLNKHSAEPADYYRLPFGRVIEIGRHVIV
jgi:KUP system potassium uptake protein